MIEFDPYLNPSRIIVVGLGGTGSQVARSVARIAFDLNRKGKHTPAIYFIDPDQVDEHNVGRQMFTAADVGQYKAEVLARRFNLGLGLDIRWINAEFDPRVPRQSSYGDIIIGAVDNHAARAAIAQNPNTLWIDCGNHHAGGQVIIGNSADPKAIFDQMNDQRCKLLPNAALLFPSLLEPEPTPEPDASCAELVQAGTQHLLINDFMGNIAAAYVYKLLHREPIYSFMTYVDLDSLSVRSIPITRENLTAYLQQAEAHES